ncbi:MAG TPA: 50S ribosomal protein L24 [Methanoregulaceae archaeon]|nr:50S ribosomal protein L24 [Methanoregulaceae archaeon]
MVRILSSQPRKQRKARYQAVAHERGSFLSAPLSKTLRGEYRRRSLRVVKGDTVKMTRGSSSGTEGLVDEVDTKHLKIWVHGVTGTKADGTEVPRPVDPSKVEIVKLNLKDPRRNMKLSGGEE